MSGMGPRQTTFTCCTPYLQQVPLKTCWIFLHLHMHQNGHGRQHATGLDRGSRLHFPTLIAASPMAVMSGGDECLTLVYAYAATTRSYTRNNQSRCSDAEL